MVRYVCTVSWVGEQNKKSKAQVVTKVEGAQRRLYTLKPAVKRHTQSPMRSAVPASDTSTCFTHAALASSL